MANEHPFQHLFETLGRIPTFHSESVNRQAYEVLSDILTVPVEKPGRCILLRAPRAGHGKTHLLSRIQHHLGASHEFIPLHASFGCRIDAATVIDDTLRRLVRQLPASGGLCVLDLVTRRLFASALQPLVSSGEVPCQDREGALAALRMRPIETFDFHHPNAVTAHWARENFEVLGQRLGLELAQRANLPVREVSFWVELLFRFAAAPLENPSRVRLLAEAAHVGAAAEEMERLEALLGLVAQLMRVVLVADDLEGFSTDETAALRLAAFLGQLRQSVDRLDVILSLNLDIWQSAFVPRLSGGLADRLSEVVVELEPLQEAEMAALLDSRVPGLGGRVLEKLDRESSGTHARGLIRAAGMAWLKATAMDSAAQPEAPPAEELPPVEPILPTVIAAVPIPEAAVAPGPVAEVGPLSVAEAPGSALQAPPLQAPPLEAPALAATEPEPPLPAAVETREDAVPVVAGTAPEIASAFTFSSESVPAPVEPPASWPVPEFAPPPPVAPAGELVPTPQATPSDDSPFTVAPEPGEIAVEAAAPEVRDPASWTPPPVSLTSSRPLSPVETKDLWDLPDDDIVSSPAAVPFQAPEPDPEPAPETVVAEVVPDSPFSSPFQAAMEPEPQPAPPVFNPPPVMETEPQPAVTFTPQSWPESQPAFVPAAVVPEPEIAPVASPFTAAPAQAAFEPAPPAPVFEVPPVEPQPASFASPFQAFQPFQPASPEAVPAPPEPAQAFQAAVEPAPDQPAATAAPAQSDADRVDELLKQFRERYGRGSL